MPKSIIEAIRAARRGPTNGVIATRQLAELKKQIPVLYCLTLVDACVLATAHRNVAPTHLTVIFPMGLVLLSSVFVTRWFRLYPETLSEAQAIGHLRRVMRQIAVTAVLSAIWAFLVTRYSGPDEHDNLAIFVPITLIASIFCLSHLPGAAFLVAGIGMSAFMLICVKSATPVFLAVAANTAFVTVVMLRILSINYRAFVQLVTSQAEANRLSQENARLAETDSLTGLPNRRHFFQMLDGAIEAAVGAPSGSVAPEVAPFALIIFDLDRFKPINDTHGHVVGDRVLVETGRRLAAFASGDVTVARLGGDEFGVLLHGIACSAEAVAFAERVRLALQQPIRLGAIRVVAGCSGGLALYPDAGRNADALFDRADYALYHSKGDCRGTVTLFSQSHEDAIRAEHAVETALAGADLAAEMAVHYQPILDTHLGEVVMVEGLARWTSPTLGRVPPDRFIAAAERSGLIHGLTTFLFRRALDDMRCFPPQVGLSFNLSSHDLCSSETMLAVVAAIRTAGIDPRRITLELTETALMRDFDRAHDAITGLRALGIKIALDDFGTGYSSLGYVHRLPLDKIKIDRSFMAGLDTDRGGRLVSTILDLSRNLGLDGIAEGIETADQLETVRRHGCRFVQGYHIGRPMPLDDLLAMVWAPSVETRLTA